MDSTLILVVITIDLVNVYQCVESPTHIYEPYQLPYSMIPSPISVNMSPIIIKRPDTTSKVIATQTAELRCRVLGFPKPVVKWEKDDNQLTGDRFEVLESGDLRINSVLITDAGDYKCCATNRFGKDNASTSLLVRQRTNITLSPQNMEPVAHTMAVFRCIAEADYTLDLRIEWLFNGNEIDFDNYTRIIQKKEIRGCIAKTNLTIIEVKEVDSGVYTCVATTPLDSVRAEANLTVQSQDYFNYQILLEKFAWAA